jgi:glucosamine kinase
VSGWRIGVDGGGTGCRARLVDGAGTVLGAGVAGPATVRQGVEAAFAAVLEACRQAAREAGWDVADLAKVAAGIGLAGIGRIGALAAIQALPHPFASIRFASDVETACLGAHSGRDGGIVIVGTGTSGLAVVGDRRVRVGGYGFPISDEGSGADLGLKAIRLSLRAGDGRAMPTALTRAVLARFNSEPAEAVAWMDRATATDYATFAPLVLRHADGGDPVGRRIVQEAADDIDQLVRTLVEAGAPRVALIGGLATPIEPWLAPDVRRRLAPLEGDAVDGALLLAGGSH